MFLAKCCSNNKSERKIQPKETVVFSFQTFLCYENASLLPFLEVRHFFSFFLKMTNQIKIPFTDPITELCQWKLLSPCFVKELPKYTRNTKCSKQCQLNYLWQKCGQQYVSQSKSTGLWKRQWETFMKHDEVMWEGKSVYLINKHYYPEKNT